MASLQEQLKGRAGKLKTCTTRVTNRKGEVFVESKDGALSFVGNTANPEYFNLASKTEYSPAVFHDGEWTKKEKLNFDSVQSFRSVSTLTFITYNVWFSTQNQTERAKALIELINSKSADVLCLQEVTAEFLAIILKNQLIREQYCCSDASGYSSITPYGVVMFCKKDLQITGFTLHPMPSNMGRRALSLSMDINNYKTIIVTAHLESLDNTLMRRAQLTETIYPLIINSDIRYGLFMGDSNFCTFSKEFEENVSNIKDVKDVWSHLHPNANLKESFTMLDGIEVAIDRVLVTENILPQEISRIGIEPVPLPLEEGQNEKDTITSIVPSDHAGLLCALDFK